MLILDIHPLFQQRVLRQFLGDDIEQFRARKLQQLDRLLKLRRHHQLLTEFDL